MKRETFFSGRNGCPNVENVTVFVAMEMGSDAMMANTQHRLNLVGKQAL